MATPCITHQGHTHAHVPKCGHTAVKLDGHTDYLHDGHLHHMHDGHVDDHTIAVTAANPAGCTPDHKCGGHEAGHAHSRAAATRRFRTAITWTTSCAGIFTIRTAGMRRSWQARNCGMTRSSLLQRLHRIDLLQEMWLCHNEAEHARESQGGEIAQI